MFQIEQMMDDKFTMLRVLDGKLQQNGDGVARQVEGVGEQVAKMLEEIEQVGAQVADALERAQRDSKKLADTSRLQEDSLTNAATAAAETLGGLSSKIDLSVARFLERASTAREEAERLAHALDAQTRALDDFSTTLPVRVSEAEAVLRGVADRLYASEELARDQAVNLSEKLSQQVDGLQSFMDRFTGRLADIDTGLDRRQADLNSLGERIGATTSSFISSWEESLTSLNDRTGNTLLRFTVVNDETRRNAEIRVGPFVRNDRQIRRRRGSYARPVGGQRHSDEGIDRRSGEAALAIRSPQQSLQSGGRRSAGPRRNRFAESSARSRTRPRRARSDASRRRRLWFATSMASSIKTKR